MRWRTLIASVASLLAVSVAQSATAKVSWPGGSMVTVASGRWGRTVWAFGVSEQDGQSCMSVAENGNVDGGDCAGAALGPSDIPTVGLDSAGLPSPDLHGEVTSTAKHVVVTFSNGHKVSTSVIAPPHGFSPQTAFFVLPIPCGTYPTEIVALGRSGRVLTTQPQTYGRHGPHPAVCQPSPG